VQQARLLVGHIGFDWDGTADLRTFQDTP
jgi:hypothetical protein